MARNGLAGTKTGTSKSARYYQNNPKARKKKAATDKKINQRPSQVKKRVELSKIRRKAKAAGKSIKGKDYDHAVGRFVSKAENRGRKEKSRVKGSARKSVKRASKKK